MFLSLFIFTILNFGNAHALEIPIHPHDVSILLPLPRISEFSEMLSPTHSSLKGELLSHDVYRFFPILDNEADQESVYQYNLKVVGIRLDPCFHEGTDAVTPQTCRRQIRFVWQPLIEARDGNGGTKTSTLDTAVHTFYEFGEREWNTFFNEWTALLQNQPALKSASLQIHPRIQSEGFQGRYWKSIRALLLKYCGDQNLIRATVMSVNQKRVWNFMGFDRRVDQTDGQLKWFYIKIPTINRNSQSFFLSFDGLFNLTEFNGGFGPIPSGQDSWYRLFSDSKKFRETRPVEELKLTVDRAIRLENPTLHNPGTSDCVSCHMAQVVRLWGEQNFPRWDWKTEFAKSRFNTSENIQNNSLNPFAANRLRSFGYFDDEPIFSQRVVNETAAVVEQINSSAQALQRLRNFGGE